MLNLLKYYRKSFLFLIRSDFAMENFWEVIDAYKGANETEDQKQILKDNIQLISQWLSEIDTNWLKDWKISYLDKWFTWTDKEQFLLKVLRDLKVNYTLWTWVDVKLLIDKINSFVGEKNNVVAETKKKCEWLLDECDTNVKAPSKARKEMESIDISESKWSLWVALRLLNNDSWFWNSICNVVAWDRVSSADTWDVWPLVVADMVKWAIAESNENTVLKQVVNLMPENIKGQYSNLSSSQIITKLEDLDGDDLRKIQNEIQSSVTMKTKSYLDFKSYLEWKTVSNIDSNKKWLEEHNAEFEQKSKEAKAKLLGSIDSQISKEQNPDIKRKLQEARWILSHTPDLSIWLALKDWKLVDWSISLAFKTWNWVIPAIVISWGPTWWWVTIPIDIYTWETFSFFAAFWANIWKWWLSASWFVWVSAKISEWTQSSEFKSIIWPDWNLDFSKIDQTHRITAWGSVSVSATWPSAVIWASWSKDAQENMLNIEWWFEDWLVKNHNIFWKNIPISELDSILKTVKEPEIKAFIQNSINSLNGWVDKTSNALVNIEQALIDNFAQRLANSAEANGWDLTELWAWFWFSSTWMWPKLFAAITKYYKSDSENQTWSINSNIDKKDNLKLNDLISELSKKDIEWVKFLANWENKITIKPDDVDEGVLSKLNICVDKWKMKELVWYNPTDWSITLVANNWISLLKKIDKEEWEFNKEVSLALWSANKWDALSEDDLKLLWQNPTYINTPKKTWDKVWPIENYEVKEEKIGSIDQFIKSHSREFQWMRQAPGNEPNYVKYNTALDQWNFEEAKTYLIKMLESKTDKLNWTELVKELNKLSWKELAIALSQIKFAMMIDNKMISALKRWSNDIYNKDSLVSVLKDKLAHNYFENLFEWKLNTEKYNGYIRKIISNIESSSSKDIITKPLENAYTAVATYARSAINPKIASYKWLDILPPWVATALWWDLWKIPLDSDDYANKAVLIDKVSDSTYWNSILTQINSKTWINLSIDDLKSLLRWNEVKWVKVESSFFAFLNWVCANESLGMEVKWFTVKKENWEEQSFSLSSKEVIPVTKSSTEASKLWVSLSVETTKKPKEQPKEDKPETKAQEEEKKPTDNSASRPDDDSWKNKITTDWTKAVAPEERTSTVAPWEASKIKSHDANINWTSRLQSGNVAGNSTPVTHSPTVSAPAVTPASTSVSVWNTSNVWMKPNTSSTVSRWH